MSRIEFPLSLRHPSGPGELWDHGAVGLAALSASLLFGVFWTRIGPQVAFSVAASLAGAAAILMSLLLSPKATQQVAE